MTFSVFIALACNKIFITGECNKIDMKAMFINLNSIGWLLRNVYVYQRAITRIKFEKIPKLVFAHNHININIFNVVLLPNRNNTIIRKQRI